MLPTCFSVEGHQFEVRRLGIDESCGGLELVERAVGPALAAFRAGGLQDDIGLLLGFMPQASTIPKLLRLFAAVSKVRRPETPNLNADLLPFLDEVFGGRIDRMIAFVVHAVRGEYGYFLAGAPALAALLGVVSESQQAHPG